MLATAYWATSAQGGVTRRGVVLTKPSVTCYRQSIKPPPPPPLFRFLVVSAENQRLHHMMNGCFSVTSVLRGGGGGFINCLS